MAEKTEKRFTVGQLSDIVHISPSALRFYDEHGVFSPELRDPNSRYRYYTEAQVLQAQLLVEMRRLNFGLEDIKEMFLHPDLLVLKEKLELRMEELQNELSKTQRQFNYAEDLWRRVTNSVNTLVKSNVAKRSFSDNWYIRFFEECTVISVPCQGNFNMQAEMSTKFVELYEVCEELNLQARGAIMTVYQDERDSRFVKPHYHSEWILRVEETAVSDPRLKRLEPYWGICFPHIGDIYDLPQKYAEALSKIDEIGLKIVGPSREEYVLMHAHTTDSNMHIYNIIFPIEYNISGN